MIGRRYQHQQQQQQQKQQQKPKVLSERDAVVNDAIGFR